MEPGIIIGLITMGVAINFMFTVVCVLIYDNKIFNLLPTDLHRVTDMNWVGCSIVSLLLFVIFPILYIAKLIYVLFHI